MPIKILVASKNKVYGDLIAKMAVDAVGPSSIVLARDLSGIPTVQLSGCDLLIADMDYSGACLLHELATTRSTTWNSTRTVALIGSKFQAVLSLLTELQIRGLADSETESEAGISNAIASVASGHWYCSPNLISIISGIQIHRARARKPLTGREQLVLAYTALGLTDNDISSQLGSTLSAVQSLARSLRRKLDARNAADLVRAAGLLGLVLFTPNGPICPMLELLRRRVGSDNTRRDIG